MTTLKTAFRKLFRKGEHSVTRIISLSAGLAFGLLLLSEVFYYYSYDSWYPMPTGFIWFMRTLKLISHLKNE